MSDRIKDLMSKYAIDKSEIWQLPGGRSYAVKHSAVERIAAQEGVTFDLPQIIEGSSADKLVVLMGTAKLGERIEWSFGEASPANNKNAYPWAMAEKRLKDRLTLKLIEAHGLLYSDEEVSQDTPTRASSGTMQMLRDSVAALDGEPRKTSHALKKEKPQLWPEIEAKARSAKTVDELTEVWNEYEEEYVRMPRAWADAYWDMFDSLTNELQAKAAAE